MITLPDPIVSVTIPKTWTPSQIVQGIECRLRAVLTTADDTVARLSGHPAAELGTVFHKLLENAARGVISRRGEPRRSVEHELNRLLEEADLRLAKDRRTSHFSPLSETLASLDWYNRRQAVLRAAERLLSLAPQTYSSEAEIKRQIEFEQIQGQGLWTEVRVKAPDLSLAGRMDVVEFNPNESIIIRDYKSGRIQERDGTVRKSIQLQLRLYGLAVLAQRPKARIHLTVSDGIRDYPIEFDDESINETHAVLHDFLSGLPLGDHVPAASLAVPGPTCAHCQMRHVCSAYIKQAPDSWVSGTDTGSIPLDTWGTVSSVAHDGSQTAIVLHDAGGRRVKVQRIDTARHDLYNVEEGHYLWMFGLSASRVPVVHGQVFHPQNFFELPIAGTRGRAWSLGIFVSGPDFDTRGMRMV